MIYKNPDFPFSIEIPDSIPLKINEKRQESGYKVHFVSENSKSIYFEIGRYRNTTPEQAMEEFTAGLRARFDDIDFGETERVEVGGKSALRFQVRWPEKTRRIHFLRHTGHVYRIILDPDSDVNLKILESLSFIHPESAV